MQPRPGWGSPLWLSVSRWWKHSHNNWEHIPYMWKFYIFVYKYRSTEHFFLTWPEVLMQDCEWKSASLLLEPQRASLLFKGIFWLHSLPHPVQPLQHWSVCFGGFPFALFALVYFWNTQYCPKWAHQLSFQCLIFKREMTLCCILHSPFSFEIGSSAWAAICTWNAKKEREIPGYAHLSCKGSRKLQVYYLWGKRRFPHSVIHWRSFPIWAWKRSST